nr:unnamed protein product [Callosobruchus analis]
MKIHSRCAYKTTSKKYFVDHKKLKVTFSSEIIAISCKIHCCAYSRYKTTIKHNLHKHMWGKEVDHVEAASGLFICYNCGYTALSKIGLILHISACKCGINSIENSKVRPSTVFLCSQCNKVFKKKPTLDNHVLKNHRDSVASVSSKIHECPHCNYKSTSKNNVTKHIAVKHGNSICKVSICKHCNTSYENEHALDTHIIKKHPNFIDSIERDVYECSYCTYKTTIKHYLDKHISIHVSKKLITEQIYCCSNCSYKTTVKRYYKEHILTHSTNKLYTCERCNTRFKSKRSLDDHILRLHRHFSATVSQKFYECSYCDYKTLKKCNIDEHNLKHPETGSTHKSFSCEHCKVIYKRKLSLDNHVLKNHPDFVASITRKVHVCSHCPFKTFFKKVFHNHMSHHSSAAHKDAERELCICYICNFRTCSKISLIKHLNGGKCSLPSRSKKIQDATSLSCKKCFKVFKAKRTLDDHVIKNHIECIESVSSKIHECTHCDYKTTNKNNANRHMLTHPDFVPKLCQCEHCNESFLNQLLLDNHIVQKHSKFITSIKSYIHACTHCSYKSTIKKYFKQHIWSHSSDKPGACKHCTATFKTKRALNEHIVKKHPDFSALTACKIYKCSYCHFKTIQKLTLDRHMVVHRGAAFIANVLTCKYCEAKFTREKILNDHIIKKHPGFEGSSAEKIHECSYCSYKTTVKQYLTEHALVHSSDKPNTCKHCSASFNRKGSLVEHIVKKHPGFIASVTKKIFECSHCTYKTSIKPMFHEHVMRNHPNLLASVSCKLYECSACGYKTARKNRLDEHSLKHIASGSSDSPFRCVFCNSTYKRKRTLDNHLLKKHPDHIPTTKSHVCVVCLKSFGQKIQLGEHILRHHDDNEHKNLVLAISSKVHICSCCEYKTTLKAQLAEHILRHHKNAGAHLSKISSKIHSCSFCEYKTTLKKNLAEHILRHHNDDVTHLNLVSAAKKNKGGKGPQVDGTEAGRALFICYNCNFTAGTKKRLILHIVVGICNQKAKSIKSRLAYTRRNPSNDYVCTQCNIVFTRKPNLDGHIIKMHRASMGSVSSKIHGCTHCDYKTTRKYLLHSHMLTHTSGVDTFNKHPNFSASVSYTIHQCPRCDYKSARKHDVAKHMRRHLVEDSIGNLTTCKHCKGRYKSEQGLNSHIIRKHSEFIGSITGKIYECSHCPFKTAYKHCFDVHMATHSDVDSNLNTCEQCTATFTSKYNLDDHVVKKHPIILLLWTRKYTNVYFVDIKLCNYKSVKKREGEQDVVKHIDEDYSSNLACKQCNVRYKTKRGLSNHIIKVHPGSVNRKIYECSHCPFKTAYEQIFDRHMTSHCDVDSKVNASL